MRTSFAWHASAQAIAQIVSWAATLVVIRFVSPDDYGLMASAMLFLGFVQLFADLGIGSAAVQAKQIDPTQQPQLLGLILVGNLAVGAVSFWCAPLIAEFFNEPRLLGLIRVLCLNFLFLASIGLSQVDIIRNLDFRLKSKIDVTAAVIGALGSLGLALAGAGVWALVSGSLAQTLARAVAYNFVRPMWRRPSLSFLALGPLLRFGALLSLDRMVFFFYGSIDSIIAGKLLGTHALGLYTVVLALAATPVQKIVPTITQVSFAAFARIQTDKDRVRRNAIRALRLGAVICFPALFGLAAIGGSLVPLLLGDEWTDVIAPLTIISLVLPLRFLSSILSSVLIGTGNPGVNLLNMIVSLSLMALAFAMGSQSGLIGIALSWAWMYPVVFAITTWTSIRVLGIRAVDVLSATAPGLLAAAAMYIVVTMIPMVLPTAVVGWTRLLLLVLCGAITYMALIRSADRQLHREIRLVFSS